MSNRLEIKNVKSLLVSMTLIGFFTLNAFSQNIINSGFEQINFNTKKPIGWQSSLEKETSGFTVKVDSLIKHKGKYSICIEKDTVTSTNQTGKVFFSIPSIYEGATIKLIGYMKTEGINSDGSAGLSISLEGALGILRQNNMEGKKITGTNQWKKYSVELNITDDVKKIVIGGWMNGAKGKVWFDELYVYIEGKELERTWVYKARLDSSYSKGSGLKISKLDKKRTTDLQLLGQVWGFLKYHHPSVAVGNLNWDYELFKFLPTYLTSTSTKHRNQLLIKWINNLGPLTKCETCKEEPDSVVKMKADVRWINGKDIGDELRQEILNVYKNRNQGKQYYASIALGIGNAEFTNEDPYEQFTFPDDGFRLLSLYRYWNIIQHFFPYRYAIDENWNSVLLEFIPQFISAKDKLEYRKAVVELIGKVHDTHANLWGKDSVWANYKGKFIPPIQTKFIENELVVTNYYNDLLAHKTGVYAGDIVTSIDGVATSQIVNERLKFYPASNYSTQLRDLAKDMLRGNKRYLNIQLKRGQETIIKKLKRFPLDSIDTRIDKSYSIPDSCYRFLADGIGYINLGNIKSNLLPAMFNKFQTTKGIVIDIRNYPSEFMVFSLSNYLLPASTPFVKFSVANTNHPGLFSWGATLNVGYDSKEHYKGKVVILINEITQSQAEYTAMALRVSKNAIVMGSTTAGADGNVTIFYLPGKLRTMISGIGIYYPDGKETQRVGISPDVVVSPTIVGIRERKDELLDKAIEYIRQSLR
jgi:C-terminal processing protease CtpA/Prc